MPSYALAETQVYPHGKKDGVVKTWKTKAEMNCFKPSDLLVREDVLEDSSDNVMDLSYEKHHGFMCTLKSLFICCIFQRL